MGFLDSLKNAANAVVSGVAKVSIAPVGGVGVQGQEMLVAVNVVSLGQEVKHDGVFIDLVGTETVSAGGASQSKETVKLTVKLAQGGTLAAGSGQVFHGTVKIPTELPPSYAGPSAKHEVTMTARLDTAGNDPNSGAQSIIVLRRIA